MNEATTERIITLKDVWNVFLRRIVLIALAAVISAVVCFAVTRLAYTPLYTSTATLYITWSNESLSASSGEAYNDFNLSQKIVYDCNYLLKSRTVVNQVIEELDLDCTYDDLYARISASNPYNTRVLEVSVQAETPAEAKQIIDRICELGQLKIEEAMGFSQVNLYEYGTLPEEPGNKPGIGPSLVAGLAAAVLSYGVFLLIFLMDDRIRTTEDIEQVLGLSILAEIPDLNNPPKTPYGQYAAPARKHFSKKTAKSGKRS